ncbi:50S ribosomal protein L4 [bacterium]|nr:50S ribosomal protein L4 [bacterium]
MKLDVYQIDGSKTGEQVELEERIFNVDPNDHLIWQAVTQEMAHRRQGTVATKTRAEVRGGGKKPWPQKGRGTARAGSIRSPLWPGGGSIFGPQPRKYHPKMTKKAKQTARKSALSHKAREQQIRIVEDFTFEGPKTRKMQEILNAMKLADTKTLLLTRESSKAVYLSSRNIPRMTVRAAADFSTYDVLDAGMLLIQKSALTKIKEVLGK